jgi:DMSO reductase anchor subunit
MHPAFSVIFLTTLLGVGQGLFLALVTAQLYIAINLVEVNESAQFYAVGTLISLAFLGLGLVASFFHLGHPERAFRTITQWKTSWLSREVIALPAFMLFVTLYGTAHFFSLDVNLLQVTEDINLSLTLALGLVGTILCFTLFICSGMIYACIKFLQEWATPLTVLNFILMGGASGFTVATVYAVLKAPNLLNLFAGWAIVLTVMAAIMRIFSLYRNARLKPKSTLKTAIGIRHSKIRQTAQGAMGGSYNTREFFHGKSINIVRLIKWFFLIMAFALPLLLLSFGLMQQLSILFIAAAVVQYVGLIAERWFFFAQANHPQNLYYQSA